MKRDSKWTTAVNFAPWIICVLLHISSFGQSSETEQQPVITRDPPNVTAPARANVLLSGSFQGTAPLQLSMVQK
jgi:hypothetical protein